MTPYQIHDSRRPWIKQEERTFTRLLREFKVDLDRKVYFEDEEACIENHFRVLETLETDPLCLWSRILSKETLEAFAEIQKPSVEMSDDECLDLFGEMSTEENITLRAEMSDQKSQQHITAMSDESDNTEENRSEGGEREKTDLICIEYPGQVDNPDRAIKTLGGLQNIGMVLSEPNRRGRNGERSAPLTFFVNTFKNLGTYLPIQNAPPPHDREKRKKERFKRD